MGDFIIALIVSIMWFTLSMLAFAPQAELMQYVEEKNRWIVALIFLLGGPLFALVTVLEIVLESLINEDWRDNDEIH